MTLGRGEGEGADEDRMDQIQRRGLSSRGKTWLKGLKITMWFCNVLEGQCFGQNVKKKLKHV